MLLALPLRLLAPVLFGASMALPGHGGEPLDNHSPSRAEGPPPAERTILDLTNDARVAHGCPVLRLNPVLDRAAAAHSADMARSGIFAHVSARGSSPAQRARSAGYPSGYIGENIAAGYETAERTFDSWMASPDHRENILNCAFTDLGVGHVNDRNSRYRDYWSQEFGGRR